MLIEGHTAALYERIERIVMEIPGIYECTVEVGGLTATLALVNGDAAVPIPPTPRCRVAGPPTREPRAPGVTPGVFFYEGRARFPHLGKLPACGRFSAPPVRLLGRIR